MNPTVAASPVKRTVTLLAVVGIGLIGAAAQGQHASDAPRNTMTSEPAGRTATETIPVDALKPLLPEAIGSWRRTGIDVELPTATLVRASVVRAAYRDREARIRLVVSDWGALATVAWPTVTSERAVDGGMERTYARGGRHLRELVRATGSAELAVILANGIMMQAEGDGADIAALRAFVDRLDLAAFEALPRGGR